MPAIEVTSLRKTFRTKRKAAGMSGSMRALVKPEYSSVEAVRGITFQMEPGYQRGEAWTWEHQALLHSRSVAGSPSLRQRFEDVRLDILMNHVRRETLREDVRAMRERMRSELSRAGAGEFDLKQDRGGIADIEFLAQYWVLRWAGKYPPLCIYSDTSASLSRWARPRWWTTG